MSHFLLVSFSHFSRFLTIPVWVNANSLLLLIIGIIIGFLSGLLGKGGSAITTPALQIFAGIPPLAALTSPLPAALPTTLSASLAYKGKQYFNRKVIVTSILFGIPATLAGSFFSDLIDGKWLMLATAIFVLALGLSFFLNKTKVSMDTLANPVPTWKISTVALSVGLLSGLLANSGGVLFGPLFIRFLKLPTKTALACSLIVSAALAIQGAIAHWYLGHIDWGVVLALSVGAIPSSYLGGRLAVKLHSHLLERIFAFLLIFFGGYDLIFTLMH